MTRVEQLPAEVRAIVAAGWFAVVFKGLQVYGVFPQRVLAQGYIAGVAEPEDRGDYEIVAPPVKGGGR